MKRHYLSIKLFEKIDGVNMVGSFGPLVVNIIMTGCQKVFVDKFMKQKIVMFYARYVDDTLLIIKKKYINYILNQFDNFDKNLKFILVTLVEICPGCSSSCVGKTEGML